MICGSAAKKHGEYELKCTSCESVEALIRRCVLKSICTNGVVQKFCCVHTVILNFQYSTLFQIESYASRKGLTRAESERLLASYLSY